MYIFLGGELLKPFPSCFKKTEVFILLFFLVFKVFTSEVDDFFYKKKKVIFFTCLRGCHKMHPVFLSAIIERKSHVWSG